MTTYYRTTDGARLDLTAEYVAALAPAKRDTLKLYSVDPQPVPLSTQYVVAGPVVVDGDAARQTWALRDKTPEQLQAEQFAATQASALETARAAYIALKNGTGTAGERLIRVERVCAHYLREKFGSEPA